MDNEKKNLKKSFRDGTLEPAQLGSFIEMVMQYRGYYIENKKTIWAGPWRNDHAAAAADAMQYAQQGYETGIRQRQS